MLGIVLASSIAKAPQAQPRLAPTRITNSGLSCVSTAVDLKTATCNTNCNAEGYDCPEACFCLPAFSNPEDDLSLAMTADDLDRISTELNTGKARQFENNCVGISTRLSASQPPQEYH